MATTAARGRRATGTYQRDVFVSGVDEVTDIGGGQIRVTFYVNRCGESGRLERVILPDCLVMPMSAVPDGIGKSLLAIGRKIVAREDGLSVTH